RGQARGRALFMSAVLINVLKLAIVSFDQWGSWVKRMLGSAQSGKCRKPRGVRETGKRASRPAGAPGSQLELSFPARWGGARKAAGRKRAERGNVPHRT